MDATIPKGQQTSAAARTPPSPVTAAAPDATPAAARSAATAMIDAGNALEEQGRMTEAMARYDAALEVDPRCARAHLNRGNILLAGGRLDEARSAYELAIACDPHYAAAHFNLGNLNARAREFDAAVLNYQAAIGIRPDFADAFVAMANALDCLGRPAEAIDAYQRALAINPGYAEVHFNLGVLATVQGQFSEAAASLRRAIDLRPDYVAALRALATVLRNLGDTDAAEASLRRARSIDPEAVQILFELAMVLQSGGKHEDAAQLMAQVLERAPQPMTKLAFAGCATRTRFTTPDPLVRAALTIAITEAWVMPCYLSRPALTLILLDRRITNCVRRANESWPVRPTKAVLFGTEGLAALGANHLLRAVLEAVPMSSIEFERFLTCARHVLLELASGEQPPDPADLAALPFYVALAQQCFINEYVFDCPEPEQLAAAACRSRLLALLDADAAVPPLLLLAVAAHFPLHTLRDAGRLLAATAPGPVEDVLRQQVREPLQEQALRAGIQCLTAITGGVSEQVREQYEQNPYPRWVKVPLNDQALHVNAEMRRALPFANFTPLADDSAPQVLVAGCGTGSHPIIAAQRFRGAQVLAIDLSLSSISYAKRKTQELGITNIEYAQADILQLGNIGRTFDIIESVGVLHHLADPFAGWRTLLSLLRPGGFMTVGFYSQVATGHLAKARAFIAARGYARTSDDIRRFRQDAIVAGESVALQRLSDTQDFYSISECRDLVFHVQEQRLTLGEIESFLAECGLRFIAFELDLQVLQQYRARFNDDPSATNLRNWARFEADNPETFAQMYRFWIQKPVSHG
jgi:tetratricopeptide (TPR) repeat protein/2-polyprenyl-3-methyl-5-hydroxy-6-metoxy-1,4-benzoquinol methylase